MMSDTTSSSGKMPLIVEDDADCAELLKLILEKENWRVDHTAFLMPSVVCRPEFPPPRRKPESDAWPARPQ